MKLSETARLVSTKQEAISVQDISRDWIFFNGDTSSKVGNASELSLAIVASTTLPVFVFETDRRVIAMNRSAERLLEESSAFALTKNVFGLTEPGEAQAFSDICRRLTNSQSPGAIGECIAVSGPEDGELFVMRIFPGQHAGRRVFLTSIDGSTDFRWRLSTDVKRAFKLTGAEMRVAQQFFDGGDPTEIASRMNLSEHTVRTHLRNLYAKTGVRGQAGLMKVLCRFAT